METRGFMFKVRKLIDRRQYNMNYYEQTFVYSTKLFNCFRKFYETIPEQDKQYDTFTSDFQLLTSDFLKHIL